MPPTTRKKSDSKLQAKLGFTPVAKDSAQAQELSPSVRSRASAVRYFSPKKQEISNGSQKTRSAGPPSTRRSLRSQQQKLQFDPRPARSNAHLRNDATDDEEDDDPFYPSQRRSSPGPSRGLPSSSARGQKSSPGPETRNGYGKSLRSRTGARSNVPKSSPPEADVDDEDEDEDDISLPVTGSKKRPVVLDDEDDDGDTSDDEMETLLPLRPMSDDHNGDGSEDDQPVLPTSSRRSRPGANGLAGDSAGEDDEDEEAIIPSSNRRLRRNRAIEPTQVPDQEDEDDEDEAPIVSSSARASKRILDESDEDIVQSSSPTKKRRLQHGPKPRRSTREEQDEEVLEDAADLKDTTTLSEGLRSTSKLNEKKLARQRELNKLLKRRNKNTTTNSQAVSSPSPTPEPEYEYIGPYNDGYSDEDSEADSIINDDDDEAEAQDLNTDQSAPTELQVSRSIYSISSALYYIIRQILSQKFHHHTTSTPQPSKDSPYYKAAHSLLNKRLESYRNQFLSSVWRRPFIASLHARPILSWPANEISLWESCEACGRRDRPASYVIRFEGSCYKEWTLSPLADAESEVWAKYDEVVDQQRAWHVGSDCHDNAWRAHRATHWKFGLALQVDKVLGRMGVQGVPVTGDTGQDQDEDESEDEGEDRPESEKEENGGEDNGDAENDEAQAEAARLTLEREDRFQATLLQMEEQGYMRALVDEFLERFEMDAEDDDDEDSD